MSELLSDQYVETQNSAKKIYEKSARRFADHYRLFTQTNEYNHDILDEELDNIFRALANYKHLQSWPKIIQLLQAMDIFLDGRGYWTELRFWLEQVINHDEAFENPADRVRLLCSLAGVTSGQGDLVEAEIFYKQAVNLANQINDITHVGVAYYGLYSVYNNQGKTSEAERCLEKVPLLARQTKNTVQEKVSRYFIEVTRFIKHPHKDASQIFRVVRQITKILGQFGKAHSLSMRAWVHLALHQYSEARRHYLKALEQTKQETDLQGTAFVLYQLGLISALKNDLTTALAYYHQSKVIAERLHSQTGLLLLYSSIGLLYLKQERFNLARPYLEESVSLARKSDNQEDVAENLYWLGYAVANTGDPEQAVEIFQESQEIFTQLNSPDDVEKVENALSNLRVAIGREDV